LCQVRLHCNLVVPRCLRSSQIRQDCMPTFGTTIQLCTVKASSQLEISSCFSPDGSPPHRKIKSLLLLRKMRSHTRCFCYKFFWVGVDRSFLQLIDSPSFRLAFGDKIPRGFNRQELSAHVRTLRDSVQSKLYSKLAGRDVFLLVDGGTLNRHRLLNVCVGSNGMSYFLRSMRVPSLTTDEVCF